MAADGRNKEEPIYKKLLETPFDDLTEEEKFTKYGTTRVNAISDGIKLVEQHGIRGALGRAARGEEKGTVEKNADLEKKAKVIVGKLMENAALTRDEEVFIATRGELIDKYLK